MADGASLYAFISISIRTHFVFQAEIKIIEAVPGRGSATLQAPLFRISAELPAGKPGAACSLVVHSFFRCYFADLEDEGLFLKHFFTLCRCPLRMCGAAYQQCPMMLTLLALWAVLWGTLSVSLGSLRAV